MLFLLIAHSQDLLDGQSIEERSTRMACATEMLGLFFGGFVEALAGCDDEQGRVGGLGEDGLRGALVGA